MRRASWCLIWILASSSPQARSEIVLNEVLPDPAGSDGGHEFVELFNDGDRPLSLAGVALQFANGADLVPSWQTRWSASEHDTLPAHGFFLIVDTNWPGPAPGDAQVRLSLQNGPDAVRLVRDVITLDLVGYGPLTGPDFFEGRPADLVTGLSLARRPDGRDTGDNAADFPSAQPTPGYANYPEFELTILDWSCEPPSTFPGGQVAVAADVLNTGLRDLELHDLELALGDRSATAGVAGIPSDGRRTVRWEIRAGAGGRPPLRVIARPGAGPESLAVDLGVLQVGPGVLELNEVQAAPDQGQGEWAELVYRGNGVANLSDFRIRDEDGDWRLLPSHDLVAGDPVVLAADSTALGSWFRENRDQGDPLLRSCPGYPVLIEMPGWPSLNNSPPQTRDFCDRLWLGDSLGVIDHLKMLPRDGVGEGIPLPEDGRSLERLSPTQTGGSGEPMWRPCAAGSGGSPGCTRDAVEAVWQAGWMSLPHRVLDRRWGPLVLEVSVEVLPSAEGYVVRVFNLWGEQVRVLGGDGAGPGSRICYWYGDDEAGRAVAPGGYIVVGELKSDGDATLSRERMVVGIR